LTVFILVLYSFLQRKKVFLQMINIETVQAIIVWKNDISVVFYTTFLV
jgi:hypothetical protein